jgi:hypothetical protein
LAYFQEEKTRITTERANRIRKPGTYSASLWPMIRMLTLKMASHIASWATYHGHWSAKCDPTAESESHVGGFTAMGPMLEPMEKKMSAVAMMPRASQMAHQSSFWYRSDQPPRG